MTTQVTQLATVTDAFTARMENAMVAAKLVEWKFNDKRLTPKNRFQYIEDIDPSFNVREWTGDVSDLSAGKQDTIFGSEIFILNDGYTLDRNWADFSAIRDLGEARQNRALVNMAQRAGERADAKILQKLMLAGADWVGTAGNAIADVEDIVRGFIRLMDNGCTQDEIFCVLPWSDLGPLGKYLTELPAPDGIVTSAVTMFNQGIKKIAGMPVLFTQQCPVLTTGTRTNGAINGAAQNVNYADVCESKTVNGNYLTQTINIDGLGANATIKDGEAFTIGTGGGTVFAYDPRKGASKGYAQQFRVIGDVTADGTGAAANVRIWPALVVASPGSATGTAGTNNANATVDKAPADNAVVTWVGSASTDYLQRAVVKKTALRVESAMLEKLPSGENTERKMKSIPLTMRSYKYANGDTGVTSLRLDAPWAPNINGMGRWEVCRINGG